MERTTVVKLQRHYGEVVQGCDIYIGRRCTMGGWNLPESKWRNPFAIKDFPKMTPGRAREECIFQYYEWIQTQPELMKAIPELKGKVLGCWCKKRRDEPCHGDALIYLADGVPPGTLIDILYKRGVALGISSRALVLPGIYGTSMKHDPEIGWIIQ
jgi:hypothetical protein